jgi:hypothetical protein
MNGRSLYARVHVDENGASLLPTTIVATPDPVDTGSSSGTDVYTFELVAEDGSVAAGQKVALEPLACALAGEASRIVTAFIPLPDTIDTHPAEITLRIARDGGTLVSTVLATEPPETAFVDAPGPQTPSAGRTDVSWTAKSADGDASAAIWFSADGQAWTPLLIASGSGSVSIDFDTLPAGDECRLRLVACNGLGTTTVDTDPFEIKARPASARLEAPTKEATTAPGVPIPARASATDEDGLPIHEAGRFSWSSSLDGVLGIGAERQLVLSTTGLHQLSINVKTGSGEACQATSELTVARSKIRVLHVVGSTKATASVALSHPALDGHPEVVLFVTPVLNPPGSKGVICADPIATGYDGTHWHLFTTDKKPIPPGAAFVIDIVQPGPSAFVTMTPTLSHPFLDGRADAVVLLGQVAASYGRQHPLNTPIGTRYDAKAAHWVVIDSSGAAPKPGSVIAAEALRPGAEALLHTATNANIQNNTTVVNHPRLTGDHAALFQVSPIFPAGTQPQGGPPGIRYDGKNWRIYHADGSKIQPGAGFAVVL